MFIAIVISAIAGILLGSVWGILGFAAVVADQDAANRFFESPLAAISGFVVGLIPIVVGAVYVALAVQQQAYKHAAIFGVLNVLLAIVLIPLDDEPVTIGDAAYMASLVPVALLSCMVTRQLSGAH